MHYFVFAASPGVYGKPENDNTNSGTSQALLFGNGVGRGFKNEGKTRGALRKKPVNVGILIGRGKRVSIGSDATGAWHDAEERI